MVGLFEIQNFIILIQEEWNNLGRRICFAVYGPPTIVPDDSNKSIFGYESEVIFFTIFILILFFQKEKHIKDLQEKVLDLSKTVWNNETVRINFIFISFWSEKFESMVKFPLSTYLMNMFQLPIIRVYRAYPNHSYFVELGGRTYDSWNDFLDTNKLPECEMCYPTGGWYRVNKNGYCDLEFRNSAECDASRQILKLTDTLTTVAGIGATVVGIVGLFTPLAPVAATALTATGNST